MPGKEFKIIVSNVLRENTNKRFNNIKKTIQGQNEFNKDKKYIKKKQIEMLYLKKQ